MNKLVALNCNKYVYTCIIKAAVMISIKQSANQLITVTCNGTQYTESFEAPIGSTYTVSIAATTEGYNTGILSTTGGTVSEAITISATAAKLKTYTVTITQSANQTISVVSNGNTYTASFTATHGQTYTASISPIEGYNAGTLSSTSGTITGPITISATTATLKVYTVTVEQPENGYITVNGETGTSFTYSHGTEITVQAYANDGYEVTALYMDEG